VVQPFEGAEAYVASLEAEAAASPKKFYGNPAVPADGRERVREAIRVVRGLAHRLEAMNRG
jgi:hypothetical protein